MNISVQITVRSDEGEAVVQEMAHLERGPLRPETLGLSLAEARAILASLEQTMVEQQTIEFATQAGRCPQCGRERACKGHHLLVFRIPFGKVKLKSPQLYRCRCEGEGPKSFSPLAERLPERTSPELAYLETKFAALVSYGLSVKLLREVLPVHQEFNTTVIETYLINNRAFIPNYGERYRKGKIISTAFVESTVNQLVSKRFVKKQQMRWTPAGAHLLLQIRTQVWLEPPCAKAIG